MREWAWACMGICVWGCLLAWANILCPVLCVGVLNAGVAGWYGMAWHGMAWYDPGYAMCKETQEGEGAAFGWYLDEWCEGDMGVQVCVRALLDFFFLRARVHGWSGVVRRVGTFSSWA